MPRNLDPLLVAHEARIERGALLRLESPAQGAQGAAGGDLAGDVLLFQYNPETVTRTRTGRWEPRKKRKGLKIQAPQEVRARDGQGSSALLAESEQVSLRVTFDATEALLAGRTGAEQGVLPQLAFLEVIAAGKEGNQGDKLREAIQPVRPDELLLILGRERIFPVVLTSLTITEQKFLPTLVPLRAEADLKLNVLEPAESAHRAWIQLAFGRLMDSRRDLAASVAAEGDVAGAISRELNRAPFTEPA